MSNLFHALRPDDEVPDYYIRFFNSLDAESRRAWEPLTGRMTTVCSYCEQPYKLTPCVAANDGLETHGVCDACFPVVKAAWAAELRALDDAERKENR